MAGELTPLRIEQGANYIKGAAVDHATSFIDFYRYYFSASTEKERLIRLAQSPVPVVAYVMVPFLEEPLRKDLLERAERVIILSDAQPLIGHIKTSPHNLNIFMQEFFQAHSDAANLYMQRKAEGKTFKQDDLVTQLSVASGNLLRLTGITKARGPKLFGIEDLRKTAYATHFVAEYLQSINNYLIFGYSPVMTIRDFAQSLDSRFQQALLQRVNE